MVGRSRSGEVDRPGPGSLGNDDRLINSSLRWSRWDYGGSSACLARFLTQLRFLGAEKVLDLIFRLIVNETEVLFDVALALELIVAQWALVLASLCGLFDVAPQGGELGETLPADADVRLVLVLGGMLLQLVVVGERIGACDARSGHP